MRSVRIQAGFDKNKPESTPQLRAFRAWDLEAAYRLDQVCFTPGIAYSRAELGAYVRMNDAKTWMAEVAECGEASLVGFVVARCDRRRQGHVITVDVAPAWRRQGVGTLLMDAAENWMRQQDGQIVYLETAEDNLPAQSFYLRRGYARLRRIEHYYGNGMSAWLMAKTLGRKESGNRQ